MISYEIIVHINIRLARCFLQGCQAASQITSKQIPHYLLPLSKNNHHATSDAGILRKSAILK